MGCNKKTCPILPSGCLKGFRVWSARGGRSKFLSSKIFSVGASSLVSGHQSDRKKLRSTPRFWVSRVLGPDSGIFYCCQHFGLWSLKFLEEAEEYS